MSNSTHRQTKSMPTKSHHIVVAAMRLTLVLGLLMGCATMPVDAGRGGEQLMRFQDVAKLLPSGHESYVLQVAIEKFGPSGSTLAPFPWEEWGDDPQPILGMAGSNLRLPPMRDFGSFGSLEGVADGVFVLDFGDRGLITSRKCLADWIPSDAIPDDRGVVRFKPARQVIRGGYWPIACVIGDRFILGASSEEEMDRALSRASDITQLVAKFPALALVPRDYDYVICRRGVGSPPQLRSLFAPGQDIVLAVRVDGGDWTLIHEESLQLGHPNRIQQWLTRAPTIEQREGRWTVKTYRGGWKCFPRVGQAIAEPSRLFDTWIMRHMLFGLTVHSRYLKELLSMVPPVLGNPEVLLCSSLSIATRV